MEEVIHASQVHSLLSTSFLECDNARLVKQRLRSWKAGEYNELWIEVCKAFSNPRARNNHNPNDDLALRRSNAFCARRAIQDDQLHKALQFLLAQHRPHHLLK